MIVVYIVTIQNLVDENGYLSVATTASIVSQPTHAAMLKLMKLQAHKSSTSKQCSTSRMIAKQWRRKASDTWPRATSSAL